MKLHVAVLMLLSAMLLGAVAGCGGKTRKAVGSVPPDLTGAWTRVLAPTATLAQMGETRCLLALGTATFGYRVGLTATSNGVFRSSDGGDTWQGFASSPTDVTCMTNIPSGVIAGTSNGFVLQSSDLGATWTKGFTTQYAPISGLAYSSYLVGTTTTPFLLIGPASGVAYRYDFTGAAPVPVTVTGTTTPPSFSCFLTFTNSAVCIAGTQGLGVYRSSNGGVTWGLVTSALATGRKFRAFINSFGTGSSARIVAATDQGVLTSLDVGSTWTSSTGSITTSSVTSLADLGAGRVLAGTTDGRLHLSTDSGQSWVLATSAPNVAVAIPSLAYLGGAAGNPSDTRTLAGTAGLGLLTSRDRGLTWTATGNAADHSIERITSAGSVMALGTRLGGVYTSLDEATTWRGPSGGTSAKVVLANALSIFMSPDGLGLQVSGDQGRTWQPHPQLGNTVAVKSLTALGSDLYLGAQGQAYISSDSGATWNAEPSLASRTCLTFGTNDRVIIAATEQGIMRTTDLETWSDAELQPASLSIRDLAVVRGGAFGPPGVFAVATPLGIFRSTDSGFTWRSAASQPGNLDVRCLAVSEGLMFAGTGSGAVYYSIDGGNRWSLAGTTPWTSATQALHVRNGYLYAGTEHSGLWRLTL